MSVISSAISTPVPACRPVTPPSRRCEKKSSRSQLVHRPERSISVDARAAQEPLADRAPGRACARRRCLRPDRRTRRAPPPPPRSSTGRCPGRSPQRSRRDLPDAPSRRSRPQARASRSGSSRRPGPRESYGQAVGDEDERREAFRRRSPSRRRAAGRHRRRGATLTARSARPGARRRRRAPACRRRSRPDPPRSPRTSPRGSRGRVAESSSVRRPRLSESNGPELMPPARVVNAARAPGSSASSHFSPPVSRHSIARGYVDAAAAGRRGALRRASRSRRRAARQAPPSRPRRRPALRHAGLHEVLAVDLERHLAPLARPLVEPLGAGDPRHHEVDGRNAGDEAHALRRPLGASCAVSAATARRVPSPGPRRPQTGLGAVRRPPPSPDRPAARAPP